MPTLHIDPALCRLWSGQPRPDAALTPAVCADLIDSIRAQGRQEFPAIVRPLAADDTHKYEIICGARRHFAVTHLCAEGLDVAFLVEPRDLNDEDAFRLADLENRSRADVTDHARACGYADALDRFYGGVQKDMAAHLGVSAPWLNRHLQLAALPPALVAAFAHPGEIREHHARRIARLLADPAHLPALMDAATSLAAERRGGATVSAAAVLRRLTQVLPSAPKKAGPQRRQFRRSVHDLPITMRRRGDTVTLSFSTDLRERALRGAFENFLKATFP
ncbi:MAG: ParB/RepB/Spo0J family partition protein [Pseudomonadota bacterium]